MGKQQTTKDKFLGGAVTALQPVNGYRAATDPVFLAASVPTKSGETVLDVGCGVGVAALCLSKRTNALLQGLEIQTEYADLARENASLNQLEITITNGDLRDRNLDVNQLSFDHVITNPPFYEGKKASRPKKIDKSIAHLESIELNEWIRLSVKRLKPKGSFSIIHRTERLPEILASIAKTCGDICVLPISAREGREAKRVLVQGRKGLKGQMRLLAPFIVHRGQSHIQDGDDYSVEANKILRLGSVLKL